MAITTLGHSWQMARRQPFGEPTIVATTACTDHFGVINRKGRNPQLGAAVTALAGVGGIHVIQAFTILDHTVMAAHTVASNAGVTGQGRSPGKW